MSALNFDQIYKDIAAGYINKQVHPSGSLFIFNYGAKAQFDQYWTAETKACRGLITDTQHNIVARPFAKFFNYEQVLDQIPNEPFEVYEKLDGSLGILYFLDGKPRIATRGSFVSEQAVWATEVLDTCYGSLGFDPRLTYLFEIIYPENRIVVDYGNTRELFLLAIIETVTGKELPLTNIGMPVVKRFDGITDLAKIKELEESNKEGFVIRFQSGFRVKVKFEEYKRLHKLITGVNARHIWEMLKEGQAVEALLDRVPDEYYQWVRETEKGLRANYSAIEARCREDFKPLPDRKATAEFFKSCPHPGILFSMLDGKDYSHHIWKLIRPQASKAFRCDTEF